MVNIPDFTLKVVQNGKTIWQTRIVVGKVGNQATPLLTETMKYITVNPTWNVPPSIISNEYLPALARDPGALARIGLKIGRNADGSIRIYQPPGERNALGRIRFNFPNRFLVYQHDTPDKKLFDQTVRAYSHGCMRVQNPDKYAEVLLGISQPEDRYSAERIQSMYGRGERTIKLQEADPGLHHLSDRVRRRRRPAAGPRRPLRPRQGDHPDPAQRAPRRRRPGAAQLQQLGQQAEQGCVARVAARRLRKLGLGLVVVWRRLRLGWPRRRLPAKLRVELPVRYLVIPPADQSRAAAHQGGGLVLTQ